MIGVLIQEAAQASLIGLDGTHGRILSLMAENILLPMGVRHGIHSTGFFTIGEQVIILFFASCAHAGENLDKLLDLRNPGQKKPTQMGDTSRNSTPKRHAGETDVSNSNAHTVRRFKEIQSNFPAPCDIILDALSAVFVHDARTRELGLTL